MADAIGTHSFDMDGDILCLTIRGEMTPEDARHELALLAKLCDEQGYALVLVDLTHSTGMKPEARRSLAEWNRAPTRQATAFYGATLAARATAALLMNAKALVSQHRPSYMFFETEAQARAWLDDERVRLRPEPPAR